MKPHFGYCHICSVFGPLTFEHVPPRRAFNDRPLAFHTIQSLELGHKYGRKLPPLTKHPRGMGGYTLCERCNGFTAAHYGSAFAEWATQALEYADKIEDANVMAIPFYIQPLRVIKQIATMALAVADIAPGYQSSLRRFVRVPFEQYLPDCCRIYVYLNRYRPGEELPPARMTGTAAMMDLTKPGKLIMTLADIALPPAGYCVVAVGDGFREPDDSGLCDISYFGNYKLGERRTVWLCLKGKRPIGPAPLNFG